MKKYFIFIAMLLVSFTMTAQNQKGEDAKEKFFQAKVREMVYRLNITDEQKPEFVKVYRSYTDAMRKAFGEGKPGARPQKPQTKEESVKMEKEKVARQQRVQEVKLAYIDELAKVLDADQLSRFFNIESQIQNKLRNKQNKGHRPGMKGPRPPKAPRQAQD
ncbi:MAG: hypothetical protein IKZ50_04370 [Bacteroidales bacterium]|nr:hypothetical protein [Bacteroidales bacterium]